MVSEQWQKTRFFHNLFPPNPAEDSVSSVIEASTLSPILQLHAIATLNDKAVLFLRDGQTSIALHLFGEAFAKASQISTEDAISSRHRSLSFSEVIPSSNIRSSSSSSSSMHYLVPVPCLSNHAETGIFAKAILLCISHLPATVQTLKDVLQFHQGLCRHIQASESSNVRRSSALYGFAVKRYAAVQHHVPLIRAAACCNLISCQDYDDDDSTTASGGVGGGDTTTSMTVQDRRLVAFEDAYHNLEDPDEIAEFRDCITHTAQAA